MPKYRIYPEWNAAHSALVEVEPQPACDGLFRGDLQFFMDGTAFVDGNLRAVWRYSILTEDQYQYLLEIFGLTNTQSSPITVFTVTDNRYVFKRYIGYINKDNAPYRRGFREDVEFTLFLQEEF